MIEAITDSETKIVLAPAVTEDELISEAAKADIGIIPYEATSINNLYCCPNKLSQYLQAGLPILSNDLPFISNILDESAAGIKFDINEYETFALAVNKVLNSQQLIETLSLNATKYAENIFHWDNFCAPFVLELEKNAN
jgi:glycosyltransferase involved in cell wall biosynthesis